MSISIVRRAMASSTEGSPTRLEDRLNEVGVHRTESYGHPVQDHSFDHKDHLKIFGIQRIEILSGKWIDSLQVLYKRHGEFGELPWTARVGGRGGDHVHQIIELEDGEDIIEVKGEYGLHDNTGIITSLVFTTNRNRCFGPYGQVGRLWKMTNTLVPFEISGRVVGFHGTSGRFVSSIGCYIDGNGT